MNVWIPLGLFASYTFFNQRSGKMFNSDQLTKIKTVGSSKYNLDFRNFTIVGIRGGAIKSGKVNPIPNVRNEFNDLLAIIKDDKSWVYNANLEPGNPAMISPINPDGTFQLSDGLYRVTRTTHGRDIWKNGKKLRIREKAFNLVDPIGQRDANRDRVFNSKDPYHNLDYSNGINIHPTNRRNPKTVEGSSYGCLNLQAYWEDSHWKEFRDILYSDKSKEWNLMILESKKII